MTELTKVLSGKSRSADIVHTERAILFHYVRVVREYSGAIRRAIFSHYRGDLSVGRVDIARNNYHYAKAGVTGGVPDRYSNYSGEVKRVNVCLRSGDSDVNVIF